MAAILCNHGHSRDTVEKYPVETLLFLIDDLAERNNPEYAKQKQRPRWTPEQDDELMANFLKARGQ